MAEKVKKTALELKTEIRKTTEENGERRIRFVATSVNQDRHYESVDVESLRLPLKKGGEIRAGAIPAEGVHDLVDIPLILNHSANVLDTIGSVRSAFYENGELVFEAGISSREIAQEMLILLEEGHLSNAFSITMSDFDYNFESETISNAEIIEVSLVFRGANKEARLLAVKSLKGEAMNQEKETPKVSEKEATVTNYPEVAIGVLFPVRSPKEKFTAWWIFLYFRKLALRRGLFEIFTSGSLAFRAFTKVSAEPDFPPRPVRPIR